MGRRAADDKSPRTSETIQICLTPQEKAVLAAYAHAKHNGKLSIAGRALLAPRLRKAIPEIALAS